MLEPKSSNAALNREAMEALGRAERITLTDFTAAISAGALTAIEARRPKTGSAIDFRPWIWAGFIIGDGPWGPNGPFGGEGPLGGGGSGMPGGG